ncbi:proteasome subunit beta type-6 [Phtheirospermum japonicum]|uniref:Proteasome subunit beta type-6 n=1 Tax=Phtheirospermum japonicum TaxID=374723 RepID=A0A830B508_9LAMI|nr:proteasome subunit beta type-6 [Phtheirospermum japonicum]
MDMISGDLNAPHLMGTTIIGVSYNGGVVLGADSRTSTGMYVANRASDKITQLTDNVYICRSGSKLVVKAVSLAIARDGASGGVVRTVTINKDGASRKFYPGDTLPLWHEELAPQNSLLDIMSAASPEPMIS